MKILLSLDSSQISQISALNVAVVIPFQIKAGNKTLVNHLHVPLIHVQVHLVIKVVVWWVVNSVLLHRPLCRRGICYSVTHVGCSKDWGRGALTLWNTSLAVGRRSMDSNRYLTFRKRNEFFECEWQQLIKNLLYDYIITITLIIKTEKSQLILFYPCKY